MTGVRWGIALALIVAGSVRGDAVDDVIATQMQARHIPGLALAVIQDGRIVRDQGGSHGLGFFVGGTPLRFGHNGLNTGFCAITLAFESGEGAVILMNGDPDVNAFKNVLVEAIGRQYRWPGNPPP